MPDVMGKRVTHRVGECQDAGDNRLADPPPVLIAF
jgi:hypothetical protein